MNKSICMALLMTGSVVPASPPAAGSDLRMEVTRRHLKIEQIQEMPYLPIYESGDDIYWDIVRLGKAAFSDLLVLVEDPTPTQARVPLFGGIYCVGDVAVIALMNMVRGVPVVEMVDDPDDPKFEQIGFGVYWAYVRTSVENRRRLKAKLGTWFDRHRSQFVWVQDPVHPAQGWYEVPTPPDDESASGLKDR